MRIGIDIDDTITNSMETILPSICEYYNLDYEKEIKQKHSYHYYHTLDNFSDYAKKHYDNLLCNVPLKDDANYYINKLKSMGNEIIFITARSEWGFKNPYKLSKEYLDRHNIKYDKLIIGAKDKATICKQEKIDVFIDDDIVNCSKVEKENIKVLLFDNYYNIDEEKFDRVYSWEEIYTKLQELADKIKQT